jgi:hypothetical protein
MKTKVFKVIYQQVPQTADSKFFNFITQQFTQDRIMPSNSLAVSGKKLPAIVGESVVENYDLITSQRNLINFAQSNSVVWIFLAEPLERVLRMVYAYRNMPEQNVKKQSREIQKLITKFKNQSIKDILTINHPYVKRHFHNGVCKSLLSDWYDPNLLSSFPEEFLVLEAKLRLKHPYLIYGLREKFKDSLRLLCHRLEWELPSNLNRLAPAANRIDFSKELSTDDWAALKSYNNADITLYQWADERFKHKLEDLQLVQPGSQLVQIIDRFVPNLHGWCTRNKALAMAELITQEKPLVVVEIGVYGGKSFLPQALALKANGQGVIHGIDAWSAEEEVKFATKDKQINWLNKVNYEAIYQSFLSALKPHDFNDIIKIHRMTSAEAAPMIDRIDILHIDGGHSEEISCQDVELFFPKVKKGGFIWFDDIRWASKARNILASQCQLVNTVGMNKNCELYRKLS